MKCENREGESADGLAALVGRSDLGDNNSLWSPGGQAALALAKLGDGRAARALLQLTRDRYNAALAMEALANLLETSAFAIEARDLTALAETKDAIQYACDLDGTSPSGGRIDGFTCVDGGRVRTLALREADRRRASGRT